MEKVTVVFYADLSGEEHEVPSFTKTDGAQELRKWRIYHLQPFKNCTNKMAIAILSCEIADNCGILYGEEGEAFAIL